MSKQRKIRASKSRTAYYQGWSDPVFILEQLRTSIRRLMNCQGNFRVRMEKATDPLVTLRPEDFPERLRGRATKVLDARGAVSQKYVTDILYHFDRLTPKQRKALIENIIALYEGCLIDIGKLGDDWDFVEISDPGSKFIRKGGKK